MKLWQISMIESLLGLLSFEKGAAVKQGSVAALYEPDLSVGRQDGLNK